MARLFLSYRRSDTGAYADRLAARLAAFQFDAIFLDREDIALGANYADRIRDELSQCDALLLLIGPGWLTAQGADGGPRLANPADWVRREAALALARRLPVIPVFFDSPPQLTPAALPAELAPLATAEGYDINGNYFDRDADDLGRRLETLLVRDRAVATTPVDARPATATAFLRQLTWMWLLLFAATVATAVVPAFTPALPRSFWIFPGSMTMAAFLWRLYWMGEAARPARAHAS